MTNSVLVVICVKEKRTGKVFLGGFYGVILFCGLTCCGGIFDSLPVVRCTCLLKKTSAPHISSVG